MHKEILQGGYAQLRHSRQLVIGSYPVQTKAFQTRYPQRDTPGSAGSAGISRVVA